MSSIEHVLSGIKDRGSQNSGNDHVLVIEPMISVCLAIILVHLLLTVSLVFPGNPMVLDGHVLV